MRYILSQHLNNAIESISQEIGRLTDLREELRRMNDDTGSTPLTPSLAHKSPIKKSTGKKTASVKRGGRSPVSEETRKKMADARRAFFFRKSEVGKRTAGKKAATKKSAGTKSANRKSVAKKNTAPAQSE